MCICVCLSLFYVHHMHMTGAHRSQKWECWTVCNWRNRSLWVTVSVLGTEPWSSARAASAVSPRAVSPALCLLVSECYVSTPQYVWSDSPRWYMYVTAVFPSYCGTAISLVRQYSLPWDKLLTDVWTDFSAWLLWVAFLWTPLNASFRVHVLAGHRLCSALWDILLVLLFMVSSVVQENPENSGNLFSC